MPKVVSDAPLNLNEASYLSFDTENSEILGFQFEPTKVLQPDSSSDESWETYSSAENKPCTNRRNEASAGSWCLCFNCSQMQVT